jgi:hypothetical protein
MKCLSLALAAFFAVPDSLYSQVEPGKAINSPFATYEDANLTEPGTISVGQYLSFSRTEGGDSLSAPGIDFSLGFNRRLELSGFGAVMYSRDDKDRLIAERDNSYLGLKFLLVSEGSYRPAVAVKPTLEFLGGTDRPHFVLPAILQKDAGFCDLALTAGYVTRGIAFSSLKCEWSVGKRVTPIAVVQVSRVTKDLQAIRDLGWNRTEVDGSAGVDIELSPHWSIFLEAGRTLGRMDENSSRFGFTASIVFTGRLWGKSVRAPRQRIAPPLGS